LDLILLTAVAVDIKRDLPNEVAILNALRESKVLRPFNLQFLRLAALSGNS
jgi:hypothetical protein